MYFWLRRAPVRSAPHSGEGGGRGHEVARVGVFGTGEQLLGVTGLDDFPVAHHERVIGHMTDDTEVVGDEHEGQPVRRPQSHQQVEDLCLGGDVQG
jgi:hypothetical protein